MNTEDLLYCFSRNTESAFYVCINVQRTMQGCTFTFVRFIFLGNLDYYILINLKLNLLLILELLEDVK